MDPGKLGSGEGLRELFKKCEKKTWSGSTKWSRATGKIL